MPPVSHCHTDGELKAQSERENEHELGAGDSSGERQGKGRDQPGRLGRSSSGTGRAQ
jgi:hypothetical protein